MDEFKRDRFERLLNKSEYDVIVASSYTNVYYLSEASIMTQQLIPERLALVVWPKGKEPILLVCSIESSFTKANSWISDQRFYTEFEISPIQLLANTLKELHLNQARVGFEKKSLSADFYDDLCACLPNSILLPCDHFFDQVRMIKSESEIETLTFAARATEIAIYHAWANLPPGSTEKDLANSMQSQLLGAGAESVAFTVLGAGDGARLAHPYARNRTLLPGDLVRIDFGGNFKGYYSDLARTGIIGNQDEYSADIYERLWSAHQEVISAVKVGITASDLFFICKKTFERLGLNFRMPHIGHGLGIGLHEQPILTWNNQTKLEPGMTLAIEPIHFETDGTRYHVEDLIVIHPATVEVVSRQIPWDSLFNIGIQ